MHKSARLLIIGSEESDLILLNEKLSSLGVTAFSCVYSDYLTALTNQSFDLLIVDTALHYDDFSKVCKFIKTSEKYSHISLVAIVDSQNPSSIELAINFDADDFIFRPYNESEIKARILNQLRFRSFHQDWEKERLEFDALNMEKNEILAIAAHDLKNPIFSIQLLGKTIRDDTSLNKEELFEFSNDIVASCDRIIDIIKQLLDLNSIESGKIKVSIHRQNIVEAIKHLIELHVFKAEKKNIKLNYDCKSDGIAITDLVSMNNIFDNFLSNAIKYSPFDKDIFIQLYDKEDKLIIDVSDRGPGIPVEEQVKLFTRFAKISNVPTDGENSTGLGLSIVKKFAELIGAELKFKNNEDTDGATFSVILPKT